jgi:hypothetical protein
MSDKKLLVSGCGITFSGQTHRTWVNVLSIAGADIVDVSGPAVSNQWILNRAFMQLEADKNIKKVVIQLTACGKLDVEVNEERIKTLVDPDSVRNFTVDDVWPSSFSLEHESKRLWKQWLFSFGLEQQDVICKLKLLRHWCDTHQIQLLVIQGYDMHWSSVQQTQLTHIIDRVDYTIMDEYKNTKWYQSNSGVDTPVLEYQIELAIDIAKQIQPDLLPRIEKIQQGFVKSSR